MNLPNIQQAARKVHKSAVCIIPPYHLIAPIQRIRCFQDKSFVRWPPHINLLYPFWDDTGSSFETAAGRIAQVVKEVVPFKLVLQQLRHFDHGASCTAWLDATHSNELLSLQAALAAAFPECSDLSCDPGRGISRFVPHLSIGQWKDKATMKQQLQVLQAQWRPLEWEVAEVALISRQGYDDPFTVRWSIPLASSAATASDASGPQRVDVPYVATIAADNPWVAASRADPNHRCRFGLGGVPTGLWNFAYGANMSPNKLGGSRGLHPSASCPGALQGYSLAFNHRGGFGNLVPAAPATAAHIDTAGAAASAAASDGGAGRGQDTGDDASGQDAATSATAGSMVGAASNSSQPSAPAAHQDISPASTALTRPHPAAGGSFWVGVPAAGGGRSSVQQRLLELGEVLGVLHQLSPGQLGALSNHEHEYWPMEVQVAPSQPLPGATGATGGTAPIKAMGLMETQPPQQASLHESTRLITAVAYISPPDRTTALGLPPTCRYLSLLQEGARHWQLGGPYTSLLQQVPCLTEGQQRGAEYYTSPDGQQLQVWPKVRTGSEGGSGRGKRGQGKGGGKGQGPAAKRGAAT